MNTQGTLDQLKLKLESKTHSDLITLCVNSDVIKMYQTVYASDCIIDDNNITVESGNFSFSIYVDSECNITEIVNGVDNEYLIERGKLILSINV